MLPRTWPAHRRPWAARGGCQRGVEGSLGPGPARRRPGRGGWRDGRGPGAAAPTQARCPPPPRHGVAPAGDPNWARSAGWHAHRHRRSAVGLPGAHTSPSLSPSPSHRYRTRPPCPAALPARGVKVRGPAITWLTVARCPASISTAWPLARSTRRVSAARQDFRWGSAVVGPWRVLLGAAGCCRVLPGVAETWRSAAWRWPVPRSLGMRHQAAVATALAEWDGAAGPCRVRASRSAARRQWADAWARASRCARAWPHGGSGGPRNTRHAWARDRVERWCSVVLGTAHAGHAGDRRLRLPAQCRPGAGACRPLGQERPARASASECETL